MNINLSGLDQVNRNTLVEQLKTFPGHLGDDNKVVRIVEEDDGRHLRVMAAADAPKNSMPVERDDLRALLLRIHELDLSGEIPDELQAIRSLQDTLLSATSDVAATNLDSVPADVRKTALLPEMDMETLFALGSSGNHAEMVAQEIQKRYPSLKPPADQQLNAKQAVFFAKEEWAAQLVRGRKVLLDSLGGRDLSKVQRLTLDNDTEKPMRLPPEISECKALTRLHIVNCILTDMPAEIGECTKLSVLDVTRNQLTRLPSEIGKCINLLHLFAKKNQLTDIPAKIGSCVKLESIRVDDNRLTSLPTTLGQCGQLKRIEAGNNFLTKLPTEIGDCPKLEILGLSGNQLRSLPAQFVHCNRMWLLDLSGNQLISLPATLAQIASLTDINVENNPQIEIPDAILNNPNIKVERNRP